MITLETIWLFQNFVSALVALLASPATPEHARQWFSEAANEVAWKEGYDCDKETLAAALCRALGVPKVEQQPSLKPLMERQARLLGQILAQPDANTAAVEWFNRLVKAISERACAVPEAQVKKLKRIKGEL